MKKKSELKQLLLLVCMMAVAFIFLVPIIWMVSASFQGQGQIFKVPFNWIPREASLKNYSFAITVGGLKDAFITSSISALLMISIQVSLSTVTGYVFSKYRFPGKKWLLLLIMMTLMIQGELTYFPLFDTVRGLKLTNNYFGLVIPFIYSGYGIL